MYDQEGKLINQADDTCYIKIKEKLSPGDVVYKTKDYLFYKGLDADLDKEFRRFPLDLKVYAYPGAALVIDAEGFGMQYLYESEEILGRSGKQPNEPRSRWKNTWHGWERRCLSSVSWSLNPIMLLFLQSF